MRSPYEGLRVVELADDPAGELTGAHLARLGADVVKVEPPEGAASRHTGPFAGGDPDPERSLSYWYYNGSKRSVTLALTGRDDRSAFERLLDRSDVFVTSLHPRQLRQLELDLAAAAAARPALIVVSITPFGLTGPWSDYPSSDLVGLAAGGLLNMCGYDDHSIPPIRPGGNQAFHTAASFAHLGALVALIQRQHTGRGDLVDVSMHDACAVTCELANPYWFYPKALVERQTCRHAQPQRTQPTLFKCADGYVYFALVLADRKPWQALVAWLDREGLAADLTDPAYEALEHRQANFSHIQGVVESFFLLQPAARAYHDGQALGLPIGILNAPEDLLHDEHLRARGFFVPVEHGDYGDVPHPGIPYRFSAYEPDPLRPAPRLGEHTAAVLAEVRP